MKTFLILLLCISQGLVWAQPSVPNDNSLITNGNRLMNDGLFKEARQTAMKALQPNQMALKTPNYAGQADAYMLIGRSYAKEENWDSAMIFYPQALHIRREILHDPIGTAKTLTSMSTALEHTEGPSAALHVAMQADSILQAQGSTDALKYKAMLYNNMANIYEDIDSLDLAISYNLKGLALFPSTRDTVTKLTGEYGLSKRLLAKERYDEARSHIDSLLMMSGKMARPDSLLMGQSYEILSAIELRKPASNPDKAVEYMEQAKSIFLRFPQASTHLANVFFNLGETYESAGKTDSALVSYKRALEYFNEESAEINFLELVQTRIESALNQKGRQESNTQLKLALYCLLLALSVLLVITIRKNRNDRIAAERLLLKEKENAANAELLLIREKENNRLKDEMFQLRHDIVKNYLQNIDLLISDSSKESTGDTFTKIKVITNTVLAQIGYANPLGKPAETLKDFALEMHLQAEIAVMAPVLNDTYIDGLPDLPILPLIREHLTAIVQEAFTNIRKYAFEPDAAQKISSIQFEYLYDEGLILTISDQGKGFDAQTENRSGLRNMENRAQQIGAIFNIESASGKGTTLRFTLPNFPDMPASETI